MASSVPPRPLPTRWDDPPWDAPLDAAQALRAIPDGGTMSGVFLAAVAQTAARHGHKLDRARERYTPFQPYPLREHAELMLEASARLWPKLSVREGLRRLGRGAPQALMGSLIGRVVLGPAQGPVEVMRALATSYHQHTRPGTLEVLVLGPGDVVVRLDEVHHFLDSHHVGVFEGAMRYAGVRGTIQIFAYSRSSADVRCCFRTTAPPR